MEKLNVLFVCIHNSARSQIAESYLKKFGKDKFNADSAGIEPGKLNQNVVEVLKEDGIDISANKTKSVFDLLKAGKTYGIVVTVCDESDSEKCPVFPGNLIRFHWNFSDPSKFTGTKDEILEKTREVRDLIKKRIEQFVGEIKL